MKLQDALYNWLTIKVVADARPDDQAAIDTYNFFNEMLTVDHKVEKLEVESDDVMYYVYYWIDGQMDKKQFPLEMIDCLLEGIESEPRYNQ
ncbi:hypothetical protein ACJ2A9_09250 [Anaerobacillus sp. MEB173]|uniref:hypothetical protein n=1 Tax=Anaerobacillus sp. MEB173 TaxID=3383345 RepID=UPI003F93F3DF